ncbi:AraC family transcriptional regulator [Paenibacillus algicola]|uniref:AraC family transcriptional regulator n=1 Tax=Paenibacillus algicola TaxID=2565926 RepID=A0A4V1G467_9BACL|nr:AraC family transcriptional regulator [Paenibacillus algicola]QCT03634.1 AraC family transcriptional regulator [Paenibacillus algicola]
MKMIELQIPPLPQFVTVGHSWWKKGRAHFKRNWNIYDLIIVTQGTLYITEDDQPYEILPGCMLLLEPGRIHWGHQPCEEETETYFMHFSHSLPGKERDSDGFQWMEEFLALSDYDPNPRSHNMYLPKFSAVKLSALIPLLEQMMSIQNRIFKQNALELHSLAAQVLLELQNGMQSKRPLSRSMKLCTELAGYLEAHMQEPFHSEKLEARFHYNFDYLTRCMKKHLSLTPLQYLQHIRIERAKMLLAETMASVEEIALDVGFHRSTYFIRMFRQKVGLTPGKYRAAVQHKHL